MVRASGYYSRGTGFDSRLYHGDFPCGGRIPVVTMVWVVSRIRLKVETSLTRSHTSINIWLNPRQRSPRWRGPHHERQPAYQLIEHPRTLIADYGRKKINGLVVAAHRIGHHGHRIWTHQITMCGVTWKLWFMHKRRTREKNYSSKFSGNTSQKMQPSRQRTLRAICLSVDRRICNCTFNNIAQ